MEIDLTALLLLFVFLELSIALLCAWCHIWRIEGYLSIIDAERETNYERKR